MVSDVVLPPCSKVIKVFDGRALFKFAMQPAGRQSVSTSAWRGSAYRCRVHYVPIAGFRDPQHETDLTATVDPFGGSFFMERLTQDLIDKARELIREVEDMRKSGGGLGSGPGRPGPIPPKAVVPPPAQSSPIGARTGRPEGVEGTGPAAVPGSAAASRAASALLETGTRGWCGMWVASQCTHCASDCAWL